MDLYASGSAVEIRYPTGQTDALYLANELAERLDELVNGSGTPFRGRVGAGIPLGDVEAIYVGRAQDWAAELGVANLTWWEGAFEFGIKVVSGPDRINEDCTGEELHIVARDTPLLLRAVWIALHEFGWRHYLPNGVAGLEELWVHREVRETISTEADWVWNGAVDHLLPNIAGGTSNLGWSDGTDHGLRHPNGLLEGNLTAALGDSPIAQESPDQGWLRHMGWTTSSKLQTNAAWRAVIAHDEDHGQALSLWDAAIGQGHYTDQHKLFTDSAAVQQAALDYANDKISIVGLDWVSLSRPDGDANWEIDFDDAAFGNKAPVRCQIELANKVANAPAYNGSGIVIQAYGVTAETPTDNVWPDPDKVCVTVVEAYRPPGRTIEDIVADYVDGNGQARCPLGLYQYLYSAAWGTGVITAKAGNPEALVESVNRIRHLPPVCPKVLTGEAMTNFGLYGLGYYCYMRMVLDIGRATVDFTQDDFNHHYGQFLTDLFPTEAVGSAIMKWHDLLLDLVHKPLISGHLVRCLWDELEAAMSTTTAGSDEEKRVAELCKFTRYLDLRNRYEAEEATAEADGISYSKDAEYTYDKMMEWLFQVRDSGLVDGFTFFQFPLNKDYHGALGLGKIWAALNEPPADARGVDADRPAWVTDPPAVEEFKEPETGWIAEGIRQNGKHGLTDTCFSRELVPAEVSHPGTRQSDTAFHPYRAKGKMKLWLIPHSETFECEYRVDQGGACVEFVNQATNLVDATVTVTGNGVIPANLEMERLYEMRLTTYATGDRIWLDWWTPSNAGHFLSIDPGREGDPCGFGGPTNRSYYFLVPDGVTEIHFFADYTANLQLFHLDETGQEEEDMTFDPAPRGYQSHPVEGSGHRIYRIAGLKINEIGFWLLNCPNLFALHPEELLKPLDA